MAPARRDAGALAARVLLGVLLALDALLGASGLAILAYIAPVAPPSPSPASSSSWFEAHVLRSLPHLWILAACAALRGAVGALLRACAAPSARLPLGASWAVVASVIGVCAAVVELLHWAHTPRREHPASAHARELARLSIGVLVGYAVLGAAQLGALLRASAAVSWAAGARSAVGDGSLGAPLLDGAAADGGEDGPPSGGAPAPEPSPAPAAAGLTAKAGRILGLARPEWPALSVGFGCLLGGSLANLLVPKFFGLLVDSVVEADGARLGAHTLQLVGILAAGAALTFVRAFLFNSAGERVVARLRGALFGAILSQEPAFFDAAKSGELLSRLMADCTKLQDAATSNVSALLRSLMMCALSIVLMAATQWQLTLVCLAVVPPMAVFGVLYGRAIRAVSEKYQDAVSRASDTSAEALGAVKTVRAFGAEALQLGGYITAVGNPGTEGLVSLACALVSGACCARAGAPAAERSAYALGIAKACYGAAFMASMTLAFYLAMVAILWFGCTLVLQGHARLGDLISFVMYAVQIGASLGTVASLFSSFMEAVGSSTRVFQLIDRVPAIPSPLDAAGSAGEVPERAPGSTVPRVAFELVSFAYAARPDTLVLEGLSLSVPERATVALVGPSGGGKSTIIGLLMRFYEPATGRILIDGVPLPRVDGRWLRRQLALVAQEPTLFACSIADNIAYGARARHAAEVADALAAGRPPPAAEEASALRERVRAAAAQANAAEFVSGFEDGYDTLVGERGVRLSGGQKQRIAIARALLHDPSLLLLDEATSALDAQSEALVQAALDTLVQQRTTLVVAHRLSTVVSADRIVVLCARRVAGVGTHAELLESCAEYQELVKRQLQGGAVEPQPSEEAG